MGEGEPGSTKKKQKGLINKGTVFLRAGGEDHILVSQTKGGRIIDPRKTGKSSRSYGVKGRVGTWTVINRPGTNMKGGTGKERYRQGRVEINDELRKEGKTE